MISPVVQPRPRALAPAALPDLVDRQTDKSDCGVGFITRKDGVQSHDVIALGDTALCAIPHRGGMSSEGVGDGAGVQIDLSVDFFSALAGRQLEAGRFGVANVFMPVEHGRVVDAEALIERALGEAGFTVLLARAVPTVDAVLRPAAVKYQLPIRQWVFVADDGVSPEEVDRRTHAALLTIEATAYTDITLDGLYPLSLSARTQVLKGRLNSGEVISYFADLADPLHRVRTLAFHTRFSTNTAPHPSMAQPFRLMAHNGELNTDRKNRLSETALAAARGRKIIRARGQSDSSRLDQMLHSRVVEDGLELLEAVVSVMPPAWENDRTLSREVRSMLEYFSLVEEKNDGPAALIFNDGTTVGARLDRLGLRPLRSVETEEYLCVTSEAGQIPFPDEDVVHRGRIEAGGMLAFDHRTGTRLRTDEALELLATRKDYPSMLAAVAIDLDALEDGGPLTESDETREDADPFAYDGGLDLVQRYVAYSLNQESFKFMTDPMLASGKERISAMGYGNAINALSDQEGGLAKYFSQRFAQVTNPPLDSIREADGMTLRVALGPKPGSGTVGTKQLVLRSPIISEGELRRLGQQELSPVQWFDILYPPAGGEQENADALEAAVDRVASEVAAFAAANGGIAILSDRGLHADGAAIPLILVIAAVNQRLIDDGLRLRVSLVVDSGQLPSSHHVASALGFGASAVHPLAVRLRAQQKHPDDVDAACKRFADAAEKALLKTMGRVGLCTVESYIGGEFFEPNYLDTSDPVLARAFPHLRAPVGGVGFAGIARTASAWHRRAVSTASEADVPLLGLFKERAEGAGHSYGTTTVRGFVDLTEETMHLPRVDTTPIDRDGGLLGDDPLRLHTIGNLEDAFGIDDEAYQHTSFEALDDEEIDAFTITPGYRSFIQSMTTERRRRPAALRDVLVLPEDITRLTTPEEFARELDRLGPVGNSSIVVRGLSATRTEQGRHRLHLTGPLAGDLTRVSALGEYYVRRFGSDITGHWISGGDLIVEAIGAADDYFSMLVEAPESIATELVQPASEITRSLASGAMSHGALVATAHEAVAHGTNMVGGMSNSGEGGEHLSRYGTIRGSRIKQFASGRFGVWAGYLADPMLQELEIKIGQGAKPGEGGQLPAPKVTIDIAAARGGTPGIELISPPPHHDTYSIEDLAQLIHDCKAARVRVVVKLVSSEGIGTIAVGVAKAGADVINVAGNTGGTGAAAVTSLKYAGRSAEIGIAEVHQALSANGLRSKVTLRCSGAHQTGRDVVISALLGGDSFEFGTTALMMLKCVMAKNCNVKCPAGLTTNPETFDGDPRALAQYLLNIAHDVRERLAILGLRSLREARGRTDLLHLVDHPAAVADLDLRAMLAVVPEVIVTDPVYMEKDFTLDDALIERVRAGLFEDGRTSIDLGSEHDEAGIRLGNRWRSVGGQLAIDLERHLNHELDDEAAAAIPSIVTDDRGHRTLAADSVTIRTEHSAGQSYAAFCIDGLHWRHTGTCNDGVGKSASGGSIAVLSPGGGSTEPGGNVLVGNFALFGATGGRTFVQGEAGDRFAVRNSGATAVVEGVGDYACEYMTNGAVLNLGGFGIGFGNGMSGGFVYQYDPRGELPDKVSADSLLLGSITEGEQAAFHEAAVLLMLEWHVEATGSPLATQLLADWETTRHHVVFGMPRALLLYQDSDAILAAKTRKELLDELGAALATQQLRSFKLDYRDRRPVRGGRAPGLGERFGEPEADPQDVYALLTSYAVLKLAQEVALSRTPGVDDPAHPSVQATVRTLILTEDFGVSQRVQRAARELLERYDDLELAAMIAAKRLHDYTEALRLRNVRSIDHPGTTGWIMHQHAKNRARSALTGGTEELFASAALAELTAAGRR
ncbi:glutamate synthase-related protein [Plantibacter sp. RU18]|uniref:glutamate synthase-related protein n=1 Tax=Plantibacter sp. RU18 TaxID=3158143 RepID=UPI003D365309